MREQDVERRRDARDALGLGHVDAVVGLGREVGQVAVTARFELDAFWLFASW